MITPAQIRAARALLGWNQIQLAAAAGLTEITIKDLERGLANPRPSTLDRIQQAFDEAGVVFFEAGEVKEGGPGFKAQEPRLSSGVGGGWIKPSNSSGASGPQRSPAIVITAPACRPWPPSAPSAARLALRPPQAAPTPPSAHPAGAREETGRLRRRAGLPLLRRPARRQGGQLSAQS